MKVSDWKSVVTPEMIEETKKKITDEFIRRFYEFIEDVKKYINGELAQRDFGWKYGWAFNSIEIAEKHTKETLSNIAFFQKNVYCGKWSFKWEKEGYNMKVIWKLVESGFLSHNEYWNSNARASGQTDLYYISQATAKQILKEYKNRG